MDSSPISVIAIFIPLIVLIIVVRIFSRGSSNISKSQSSESMYVKVDEEDSNTQPAANEEIINELMGYDNAKLREIIEKPKFYNTEVVDKARELLGRREAWEHIKDMPDEKLSAIVFQTGHIVEAASMELYQRESNILSDYLSSLSSDAVRSISDGSSHAPEGIRLAAQRWLDKNRL